MQPTCVVWVVRENGALKSPEALRRQVAGDKKLWSAMRALSVVIGLSNGGGAQ